MRRYDGINEYTVTDSSRGSVTITGFKTYDLIPSYTPLLNHTIKDGELLDFLAFKYMGDEKLWWEIAEANPVLPLFPLSLPVGATIKIPRQL